jgi:putative ATPase
MARAITRSLFKDPEDEPDPEPQPATDFNAPLAERMRPRDLDEFVGQEHLVGQGRLIRRLIEDGGSPPSLILWGGPGTGKTTLARLLAGRAGARFVPLSAVLSGVKELREAIAEAREARRRGSKTILFVDEIHRFNKSQQDALLPAVEDGTVALIGATTENPSFEVNAALLSRSRVVTLHPLTEDDVATILRRALLDPDRGLRSFEAEIGDAILKRLARSSQGDARVALTALEAAVRASDPGPDGIRRVDESAVAEALGRARFGYDKGGEEHYNLASALVLH